MLIIVPNEIDGLEEVEKNLEKISVNYDHIKNRYTQKINLSLPKFKIESEHDLKHHLSEVLKLFYEVFFYQNNFLVYSIIFINFFLSWEWLKFSKEVLISNNYVTKKVSLSPKLCKKLLLKSMKKVVRPPQLPV